MAEAERRSPRPLCHNLAGALLHLLPQGQGRQHRNAAIERMLAIAEHHATVVAIIYISKFLVGENIVEVDRQRHILHVGGYRVQFRQQALGFIHS